MCFMQYSFLNNLMSSENFNLISKQTMLLFLFFHYNIYSVVGSDCISS